MMAAIYLCRDGLPAHLTGVLSEDLWVVELTRMR